MKVRYIGISTTLLSYGEVYKVLKESENFYEIIANGGTKCSVRKRLFEIVKENNEMKDLTLPEVFNYPEGTKFKIGFDNWKEDQYLADFKANSNIHKIVRIENDEEVILLER